MTPIVSFRTSSPDALLFSPVVPSVLWGSVSAEDGALTDGVTGTLTGFPVEPSFPRGAAVVPSF